MYDVEAAGDILHHVIPARSGTGPSAGHVLWLWFRRAGGRADGGRLSLTSLLAQAQAAAEVMRASFRMAESGHDGTTGNGVRPQASSTGGWGASPTAVCPVWPAGSSPAGHALELILVEAEAETVPGRWSPTPPLRGSRRWPLCTAALCGGALRVRVPALLRLHRCGPGGP